MTRVVRHPPGKERPRDAPMVTLPFRRAGNRFGRGLVGRWHSLTIRLEARRGVTRPRKWRRWVSYANVTRAIWLVAVLAVLAWVGEGLYIVTTGHSTGFEKWRKNNQGVRDRGFLPLSAGALSTRAPNAWSRTSW